MITAIDRNTALVLIDLQKGVVKAETVHPVKDILNRAAFLASAFRRAELPVVVVHVNPEGAAWTRARVDSPAGAKNPVIQGLLKSAASMSDFTDIVPEIGQHEGDILIMKKTWNAFYKTPLHEALQKLQVTGIVLAGISTSIGVEGTARAASELGYNISFAMDAITDRLAEAHRHSVQNIFPRIGELGTAAEIAQQLSAPTN